MLDRCTGMPTCSYEKELKKKGVLPFHTYFMLTYDCCRKCRTIYNVYNNDVLYKTEMDMERHICKNKPKNISSNALFEIPSLLMVR